MRRIILVAILSTLASSAFAQAPGPGSCYGNDVPTGMTFLQDPVTGLCWPATSIPGAPGVFSDNFEGTKLSYSAYFSNVSVAAAATDIAILKGSATKTIRVTHAEVSCTASAGINFPALLVTYASTLSAGTPTTIVPASHDRSDTTSTAAAIQSFTANPTVGTIPRVVRAGQGFASNAGVLVPVSWDFGIRNAKNVVLRGVAQYAAINLGAATLAAGLCSGGFEYTEEPP